jgi:uncharacterized protein DUF1573
LHFMSAIGSGRGWWRGAVGVALACVATPAMADTPRLVVGDAVFDFGTVEQGASVEHTFVLGNAGDATLRIDNVKSSCGCTVAVLSARDVPPGGEGRVTVTLDTARMVGAKTKTVTVYTNDPAAGTTGLTLHGSVLADFVIIPDALYLGRLHRGEPSRHEAVITSGRPGTSYEVLSVEQPNPAIHARLEPRADGPGQRLVVELDRDMPLGRISEQLTLRTSSPHTPVVTVPVFGSVEGDVAVLPPQVTFGVAQAGETPERELLIRNRGTRPLTVTRVAVRPPQVSYQLREVEEGVEYRLTLRLGTGAGAGKPAGKVEGAVEIFTDHPDERHIVVPLYAVVRDARHRRS